MLELLPAALATELLICPDSLSYKNVLSADPHILHGVTANLQIRGQNDWKWMDGMIINRSWVTNWGAWSWVPGDIIINFRALQRIRRSLGRRVLTLHPSFVQNWKVHKSVCTSRDDSEIHNHSSLWHWWKLYWIKCIDILIMNLWYSELPLGHQYLICNHILQAAEWLSGYACADPERASSSTANQLQKDDPFWALGE